MLQEMQAASGGSSSNIVYWFSYGNATYYLFQNGVQVSSGYTAHSYEDDTIKWTENGHTCTLIAKKHLRLYRGSGASPTIREYSASDYIYNGQTNFYNLMPVCLQIL